MKPKSRRKLDLNFKILKGHPLRSILLHYASRIHYVSLLIFTFPAFLISSCTEKRETVCQSEEEVVINITIEKRTPKPVKTLDVLVYESDNTKRLMMHRRLNTNEEPACPNLYEMTDTLVGTAPEDAFIIAAIANLPFRLKLSAVGNFGSLELVKMSFSRDDIRLPVMSGWGTTDSLGTAVIPLSPLMSSITVRSVSNMLDTRASNPGIWLENANSSVEILRGTDFCPTEVIDSCEFAFLPSDIGKYTQYPNTILFCYPNDCYDGIGTPGTRLAFQYELNGCRIIDHSTIPPFSRSENAIVDIRIQEDSLCHFEWAVQRTE